MLTEDQEKAILQVVIDRMADEMPPEVEDGFWAKINAPLASLILRPGNGLTYDERMLLVVIAARAVRADDDEQAAREDALAAIRRAGGGA